MKKDDFKTEVVFRKEKTGKTIAVFPYVIWDLSGDMTCFSFHEGHGPICKIYMLKNTKPAKLEDCGDLEDCLQNDYGYNLHLIKKIDHKRYMQEFEKQFRLK